MIRFSYVCVIYRFICIPREVIFRYRVIGACPVTMDCNVTMSQWENNNNNNNNKTEVPFCVLENQDTSVPLQLTATPQMERMFSALCA